MAQNWYLSVEQFHSAKRIETDQTTDDAVIGILIESASRYIDRGTARRFYLNGQETHYFNVPGWEKFIEGGGSYYSGYGMPTQINEPRLMLDNDLYSLTSVVNGDGTTLVENMDFVQVPFNTVPKYALVTLSMQYWKAMNNIQPVRAIQVTGQWGYCDITNVPGDIVEACLGIVTAAYNRRLGENIAQKVVITAAGATISADDVPSKCQEIISCYRRMAFG